MLISHLWTIYLSVQVWVPDWRRRGAGFAILRNASVWELGGFKAAANTGNCLHWWGGSATSRYQAKSVLRYSKDVTVDLWSFHRELSLPMLYSYKACEGWHRAEGFLFPWCKQEWHTAWTWRWWREIEMVPRKGWSPCRERQLLGWGNPGRKTIFAAAVWIANTIYFYSDSFWLFSTPKGALFSSAHKTWP